MLRLVRGMPNPAGAEGAELYLFAGDATAAPIHEVIPADDVVLPQRLPDLAENPLRLSILHFGDLHGSLSNLTPAPGGHLSPAPGGHLSPAAGGHLSPAPGGHLSPAPGGHLSPAPRGRSVDHGSEPSFSRIVWRVRQVRRESRNDPHHAVLFLSGGDDLGGAVYDELLGDDVDSYRVHAGYHLYSAAGVDAGVVGNHDFDQGVALLAHAIERDARFPLLSANLTAPALADRLHPAALLVVKGLRIGLVGLTTPAEIKHRGEAGLRVTHPLVAARNLLPALRPLCDVLIILSHLGHSLGATTAPTRDAGDVELASSMPPDIVHLIIGAHTHTALNETGLEIENIVNNIPIVEAGPMGRYLGEVELAVGDRAAVTSVRLNPAANLPADYHFERREVWPLLDQLEPILARPLGRIADHPDLTTAAVRNRFAAGESALANLIADALVAGCRDAGYPVDLAAIDASSAYHGLPAGGELTFGDWFQVMPFADTVRICPLTGKELAALIDDNARRADRPGEPHVERGFLHFSHEMRYTIEQGPDRHTTHAVDVTLDGQPLEGQQTRTFLVACTNFIREHAAPWEHHATDELDLPLVDTLGPSHTASCATETDLMVRDTLIAHITAYGGVTEEAGARRDGRLRIRSL